jgi:hypothetical protein
MVAPGVNTLCYLVRRGVVLIPGDIVWFDDEPALWEVVGVKRGLAFLDRVQPPTDAEIHAWIAS